MISFFYNLNYIEKALIAGLFTWTITTLGAMLIIFFKKNSNKVLAISLALSAGIMLSASIFSLINPAIEEATKLNQPTWLIISLGLLLGSLFIYIIDKDHNENKTKLMFISITMHNIPEGAAVGIAFGMLKYNTSLLSAAICLTIAIGLQNFPEGFAISLPLNQNGKSKFQSIILGSLSAIVEPIAAVISALLVTKIKIIMPFMLSFAAGSMFYVIMKEMIPESSIKYPSKNIALYILLGFIIMMILDISL